MKLANLQIQKQVPITKARRIFSDLIEMLPKEHYFILVKNYQPRAILLNPSLFEKFSEEKNELDINLDVIRQSEEGRFSNVVNKALTKIEKMPKNKLPKLLQK